MDFRLLKNKKRSIVTWEILFGKIYKGDVILYKKRLRKLRTTDKPIVSKNGAKSWQWLTWAKQAIALEGLILEQYPNTIFTSDNRTILKR